MKYFISILLSGSCLSNSHLTKKKSKVAQILLRIQKVLIFQLNFFKKLPEYLGKYLNCSKSCSLNKKKKKKRLEKETFANISASDKLPCRQKTK